MRVNKKLILSLLTVGMLAVVASAGTWAYFQDTITSTGNGVTTAQVKMNIDGTTVGPNGIANIPGVTISNVIPESGVWHQIGSTHILKNVGTTGADVYVKVSGTKPVALLAITIGGPAAGPTIINFNDAPKKIGTNLLPGPGQDMDVSVGYYYTDSGNQNGDEGLTTSFDVTYYMVPTGTTVNA
jgi:predicted ribosomally synthesized peptide with SipW-like signal peptide